MLMKLFFTLCAILVVIESRPDKEIKDEDLPSKVQQRNLISTGRELCSFIRDVVSAEANESEGAVQKDVGSMVQMAKGRIALEEENYILKLSCTNNDVKSRNFHEAVPKLRQEVEKNLEECRAMVADQTSIIANKIQVDAMKLEQKGQDILNEFLECSKKGTWSMFSCYKRTMGTKMSPLKEFLMETVRAHSGAHTDFLTARSNAAACIEQQIGEYHNKIESMYNSYKN